MCDYVEQPSVSSEKWRRARKGHQCCACRETIRPGDRYHHLSGIWDGEPDAFKHCARCWHLFQILVDRADGEVSLRLDCGTPWGDVFDPAEEPGDLAFLTPDEAQELAP